MHEQLLPIYILAGIFAVYTIKFIVVYLWDESMRIAAEAQEPLETVITDIKPTPTPFMELMKRNAE